MSALTYALPAAAAGLAYLNGRHALTYDFTLLSAIFSAQIRGLIHEKRDDINAFYVLENHALGARAHHTWIIFNGQSWTYAQAYEISLKYGAWLKTKGVQKEEIVAMDFWNSEIFIWVWFGLWSIGAKPAFINYNLTGKPLLHTIRTSTARLVLVDQEGKNNFSEHVMAEHGFVSQPVDSELPAGQQAKYSFDIDQSQIPSSVKNQTSAQTSGSKGLEIIFFDKSLQDYILTFEPTRLPDSERSGQLRSGMAMLIYTSGTTGLPKPAVMSWGKANLGSKFVSTWIPFKKEDIIYTSMPLYHSSASVLGVCAMMHAGGAICLSKKFSHKTFWPEIRSSNATVLHYVGETCRYLVSAPPSTLDKQHNIRAAFGNGLRPDVWEPFKARFGIDTIFEFYSATEAPAGMWNYSGNSFSSGAIGRTGTIASFLLSGSLAVVRMDPESDPPEPLRDPQTGLCQIVDPSEAGELLYKLDPENITLKFQGYFGNNKATNSKIMRNVKAKGDAYFRSGDLMRWDEEGRWWFVDRIGDTFRWKAENVSTAEVADVIGRHDSVDEANVYGVQVPRHDGRAGCAAIIFKPTAISPSSGSAIPLPTPQTLKALADHVKKELPAFAVPIWIRVTKEMQTTGTNKQQKHLLQIDGIDPRESEKKGDVLYWLKDGTYERFTLKDLERVGGGAVKL